MNKHLSKLVEEWMQKEKTGKITINFFKGGVSSVNKEETIKLINNSEYERRG